MDSQEGLSLISFDGQIWKILLPGFSFFLQNQRPVNVYWAEKLIVFFVSKIIWPEGFSWHPMSPNTVFHDFLGISYVLLLISIQCILYTHSTQSFMPIGHKQESVNMESNLWRT